MRRALYQALGGLDELYHRYQWLPFRLVCQLHEATLIEEYPELPDWPGGRILTAFHRWWWSGVRQSKRSVRPDG